ncbi:MAG TPA: hypothetical protein VFI42_02790 [Thermomicrobiaceae bacterium]|nr:hypothetical protein [Thermomicrobiaceae bacterium]
MSAPGLPVPVFRPGTIYEVEPRPEAASRARLRAWVMVRLTGLLLTVLVLGHFSLTHIFTDVSDTGTSFIARRWGTALWVVWDWLLLLAAVAHGGAGIWVAIADYTPAPAARARRQRALLVLSVVVVVLGTAAIVKVTLG